MIYIVSSERCPFVMLMDQEMNVCGGNTCTHSAPRNRDIIVHLYTSKWEFYQKIGSIFVNIYWLEHIGERAWRCVTFSPSLHATSAATKACMNTIITWVGGDWLCAGKNRSQKAHNRRCADPSHSVLLTRAKQLPASGHAQYHKEEKTVHRSRQSHARWWREDASWVIIFTLYPPTSMQGVIQMVTCMGSEELPVFVWEPSLFPEGGGAKI